MFSIFARDRFGKPQLIAIAFLLAYMAQCLWLMAGRALTPVESEYVAAGSALWSGRQPDSGGSRLVYLAAAAGATAGSGLDNVVGSDDVFLRWGARVPFLGVALLLGGSLWYVTRRLYGNIGGYIALALYCFTPAFVERGAEVNAEVLGAWGVFGIVFAAIASAHTLYAPLTWRQRTPRVVLLGTAMGLALGASPSTMPALALALLFILYLAPGKRATALALLGAALAIGALWLLLFHLFDVAGAMAQLTGWRFDGAFGPPHESAATDAGYLGTETPEPLLVLMFFLAVAICAFWRRARYFGNLAPLLAALVLAAPAAAAAPYAAFRWMLPALPFVFVFIAGVFADLLEMPKRKVVLVVLVTLLALHAGYSLIGLTIR